MDILNWSKEPKNRLFLYQELIDMLIKGRFTDFCCIYLNSNIMRARFKDLGVETTYDIIGYRKDRRKYFSDNTVYLEDLLPELLKYKQLNIKPGDGGATWFVDRRQRINALQLALDDLRVGHNIPITI